MAHTSKSSSAPSSTALRASEQSATCGSLSGAELAGGAELARAAVLDPAVTVDAFRKLVLQRVGERNDAIAPTDTGRLSVDEADAGFQRGGWNSGAHNILSTGKPLQCFTSERAAYAFGMFLQAQMPGGHQAARWMRDNFGEQRVLSNQGNSAGVMIPTEISSEIIKNLDSFGVARREARTWIMSTDQLVDWIRAPRAAAVAAITTK